MQILSDTEVFTTPKPVALLVKIFQIATNAGDLILDSFASSGTSAHAILELNKDTADKRKFILVQMPYDTKEHQRDSINIAKRITAERVRRVIRGYIYPKRGAKGKVTPTKIEGLGGSFSYLQLGKPLFCEYRAFGTKLPPYEELAKYIFYTETSHDFSKKAINSKTGKIGEDRKTSYYLLYTPNNKEGQALSPEWLKSIEKSEKNKNLVVYCEKIWIHRDDLAKYQKETGRKVRPMLIPFNLK